MEWCIRPLIPAIDACVFALAKILAMSRDRWQGVHKRICDRERWVSTFCRHHVISVVPLIVFYILLCHLSYGLSAMVGVDQAAPDTAVIWLPSGFALVLTRRIGVLAYLVIFVGEYCCGPNELIPYNLPIIGICFGLADIFRAWMINRLWQDDHQSVSRKLLLALLASAVAATFTVSACQACGKMIQAPFYWYWATWVAGDIWGTIVWRSWAWPQLGKRRHLTEDEFAKVRSVCTWQTVKMFRRQLEQKQLARELIERVIDASIRNTTVPDSLEISLSEVCAKLLPKIASRIPRWNLRRRS